MANPFNRARVTARHRVMVVSAKGGVGKSTVTVNLAAALVARGLRVGIFDADVHGPNIPAILGIRQTRDLKMGPNPQAMVPIQAHPDSLDTRPITPFDRYGIRIMSLGLIVGEQQMVSPEPDVLGQVVVFMLNRVDWGGVDVLLLDMPPGTGEPLHSLMDSRLIDGILLVATRERLAHLDNGRLFSFLRGRNAHILGVIENMTHMICPNCGEQIELYPAPVSGQSVYDSTPVLAALPFHPKLIRQVHGGPPLPLAEAASPVTQALLDLADEVILRLSPSGDVA